MRLGSTENMRQSKSFDTHQQLTIPTGGACPQPSRADLNYFFFDPFGNRNAMASRIPHGDVPGGRTGLP
jgi:hypothetical protein